MTTASIVQRDPPVADSSFTKVASLCKLKTSLAK
jgi:hypothetical protein